MTAIDTHPPLRVDLLDRGYPIHFGQHLGPLLRQTLEAALAENRRVAVIVDASVRGTQADWLSRALPENTSVFSLPVTGEEAKSSACLESCYTFLAEQRIDRSSLVVAIGGGVMGDLVGYAAATWLRGVALLQVPTTLLAMVDSSVGGKTGINTAAGKNLVGAFHQPEAVFIDTAMLETLPAREFAAGMAEVIKYGLLADAALFQALEQLPSPLTWNHQQLPAIIRRCCAIKATIVRDDERETAVSGGRALLNLGHTYAHAIEKIAGYGTYLHGEAVAIGLVAAARHSASRGLITPEEVERITTLIARQQLPIALRTPLPVNALVAAMQQDKKVRQGTLRMVLIETLGQAITTAEDDPAVIETVWRTVGAI